MMQPAFKTAAAKAVGNAQMIEDEDAAVRQPASLPEILCEPTFFISQ